MFEGSILRVTYKQDAVLAYAFPGLDRGREYREMDSWLIANPHKRPRRHMARFVHNWLSKAARQRRAVIAEAVVGRAPAGKVKPEYAQYLNAKQLSGFKGTFAEYRLKTATGSGA